MNDQTEDSRYIQYLEIQLLLAKAKIRKLEQEIKIMFAGAFGGKN